MVLLGIEHFQQCGGRVALNAGSELVDFIEHHHAIARTGLLHGLDDVARQRPDIRAAVTADLCLVVDAAQTQADEGASHGAGNGLAQRGLADSRGTNEAKDRRLPMRGEFAHRQILDNPLLDLVEAVVIGVENAARLSQIDRGLVGKPPRQFDQAVKVGPHHAVLGGGLGHALEPAQLLARFLLDLRRHAGLGNGRLELGRHPTIVAQFALDGRHLLAQDGLALSLVEGCLGLLADLV